jgi:hypothetical protein
VHQLEPHLTESPPLNHSGSRRRRRRQVLKVVPYLGIALAAIGVFAGILGALGLLAEFFD